MTSNVNEEIRVQLLDKDNFNHGKLFKLSQGWKLRLQLSNNIINENVRVFCNFPIKATFDRNKYYELKWENLSNSLKHDDFNKFIDIHCIQPGSFNYFFTLNGKEGKDNMAGGSNFLVDPKLTFSNGQSICLNSLQIHTVLTKLLGPLDEWKSRLVVSKECNYNMIHFTPVQDLCDESRSSYCISDHLNLMKRAASEGKYNLDNLEDLVGTIYKDWNMFSISDLVYNHMSNRAPFIKKCPQATFNLHNSPYLIPAFVLDRIFYHATLDINKGVYESQGITRNKLEAHNLETLRHILRSQEIPKYKLEDFFMIDTLKVLDTIKQIGLQTVNNYSKNSKSSSHEKLEAEWRKLKIVPDPKWRRLMGSVDSKTVEDIFKAEIELENDQNQNDQFMSKVMEKFKQELYKKNGIVKNMIDNYLTEAVENVLCNVRYHFFAHDGPKWQNINKNKPLVRNYFYFEQFPDETVHLNEQRAYEKQFAERIHAHNGWVMGDDPLRNFASEESTVYFRRHLIVWGDSAKLRYGNGPEDNPELWEYMADYTIKTAKIFHGVRLDNCHSTPIHVAQYFLDKARLIRPNLYIIAELFTNSENLDNKFITELGITALIREALSAYNSNDLGRLVHRFGGEPAGSFIQLPHRPLLEGIANAILYDVTHDNPSLIKSHSIYDVLPTSSLVLMSGCAVASTRGFDELVPHEINVVSEERPYSIWSTEDSLKKAPNSINIDNGIIKAKQIINKLHFEMGIKGYSQIYVDQFDAETTVVTRHNPETHNNIILIARTAFSHPTNQTHNNLSKPLAIPSKIQSVLFEANLRKKQSNLDFKENSSFINGLIDHELKLQENVINSDFIDKIDYNGSVSLVHFKYFPPGTVIAFNVVLNETSENNLVIVKELLSKLTKSKIEQSVSSQNEIENILNNLTLDELNILLFRCGREEESERINSNTYNIPNFGPLTYCGLQGIMNILEKERLVNNLGHPLFENLRDGDWLMNYIADRLEKYYHINKVKRSQLLALSVWLRKIFNSLSQLPRYLIPKYFDMIITTLYVKTLEKCWKMMSTSKNSILQSFKIENGSSFVRMLALGGIALTGHLKDCPMPNTLIGNDENELLMSMSAGLPHFSVSYMRCWGRDTFISLKGLLMLTNRQIDARNLILCFGSCLRHGLIPNLLCEGRGARYNARDAVWWWLKAIRDYCELYDTDILNCSLYRLYPNDDAQYPNEYDLSHKSTGPNKQKLFDVIQEALDVHLNGLKFRERNAGPMIDDHMTDEGFNIEIGVDLNTGFVFGGNMFNCGTWCDKMGSSVKAGNNGYPATPRDGSAVELVGLSRCVLEWLIQANAKSKYPYDGVLLKKTQQKFTWKDWAKKIDDNFEKYFWIDENSNESTHINKRNIYKDTLNSSVKWADYQFRPNFLIAITVAPQMINKEHAARSLEMVKKHLMNDSNSLGIKTLDESDLNYCGNYDNSNNSTDKKVAHGFNYHQGPEWLWPVGYFLRALLMYSNDHIEAISLIKKHLGKLYTCLTMSDWKSLPELTNKNGEECYYSCSSQAWSLATILEVFYDLANNA